jgi:hypothetical protein
MRKADPSAGRFRVSRQAARALRARWRAVALREREELRAASCGEKLQQLVGLVESVRAFGWEGALAEEDEAVRERWRRLRRAYRE